MIRAQFTLPHTPGRFLGCFPSSIWKFSITTSAPQIDPLFLKRNEQFILLDTNWTNTFMKILLIAVLKSENGTTCFCLRYSIFPLLQLKFVFCQCCNLKLLQSVLCLQCSPPGFEKIFCKLRNDGFERLNVLVIVRRLKFLVDILCRSKGVQPGFDAGYCGCNLNQSNHYRSFQIQWFNLHILSFFSKLGKALI